MQVPYQDMQQGEQRVSHSRTVFLPCNIGGLWLLASINQTGSGHESGGNACILSSTHPHDDEEVSQLEAAIRACQPNSLAWTLRRQLNGSSSRPIVRAVDS